MPRSRRSATPEELLLPIIPRLSIPTFFLSSVAESEAQRDDSAEPSNPVPATTTFNTTKREYALLELLQSERIYARDLVLLRDYQIPLASGRLSSMSSIWPAVDATICQYLGLGPAASDSDAVLVNPPGFSSMVPRPLTTASSISALSSSSIFTLRPMKTKDVNIVFSNIEELATFSEDFLHQLESSLGELIEGNNGEDSVGGLFLDFLPQMELLYKTYIINQPYALEHYHRLSKTFQFDVYFPRSQILAHKSSNAWDLPSLLIKPIQRLLYYPQLLSAIIVETPDSHGDKAKLVEAHARMAEIARGSSAQWRQQKVVQDVLASEGLIDTGISQVGGEEVRGKKKNNLKVGLAASVSLGRIMNLRSPAVKTKEELGMSKQAEAVTAMSHKLKSYEPFMTQFVREMVDWVDRMHDLVGGLNEWANNFGRVVWMDSLEEQSYLALRAQLFAELPTYLTLLDKGMATCMVKFASIQERFYSHIYDRWRDLWVGLNTYEEANLGAEETLRVWHRRFTLVETQITCLKIAQHPEEPGAGMSSVLAALGPLNISMFNSKSTKPGRSRKQPSDSSHNWDDGTRLTPPSSTPHSTTGLAMFSPPPPRLTDLRTKKASMVISQPLKLKSHSEASRYPDVDA
ncbi:hypothetical protein V8D89_003493 [Ganoderma adspersum]